MVVSITCGSPQPEPTGGGAGVLEVRRSKNGCKREEPRPFSRVMLSVVSSNRWIMNTDRVLITSQTSARTVVLLRVPRYRILH